MKGIDKYIETVKALRNPETGCPWDLKQDHESLKKYLLEETYECLEAIDQLAEHEKAHGKDKTNERTALAQNLKEELGDVLLQVLLHSQIADDNGDFSLDDVSGEANDKIVSRHPHVFDENTAKAENVDDVLKNWDSAKKKEKSRESVFDGIPREMPSLARALKISKRAVKESFEWDREDQLWQQLASEIDEFKEEVEKGDSQEALELELGDILFTIVNIARWYKVDPEDCLRKTNNKFVTRFNKMVEIAKDGKDKTLKDYTSTQLEDLWQQAKLAIRLQ